MKTLSNKVALVTGRSCGLGEAIVEPLVGEVANVAFTCVGNTEPASHS